MILAALALVAPASLHARTASDPPIVSSDFDKDKTDKADKSDKADKADKAGKAGKTESADIAKQGDATSAANASDAAGAAKPAAAAADASAQAKPAAAPAAAKEERDDAVFNPAQPDFTLISLPTSLRLPKFKSAFRVTHRFTRPLDQGSFSDLAQDFFALDSSAQIGLEFRFGVWDGLQAGINRTNDRDIEFFAQYSVLPQTDKMPFDISAWGSIDGTNNFRDSKSPAVGAIVSHLFPKIGAVYVEPIYVNNSNPKPKELADHNDTFFIGLGTRVQVYKNTYVTVEVIPRVAGFKGADDDVERRTPVSFALEKRVGGHMFQINFGNGINTTMAPIARGAPSTKNWFLGFNITRKFF